MIGVVCQYSLPMTIAPVLRNVAIALAKDRPAIEKSKLTRTTCSYKLNLGLAHTIKQRILCKLKVLPFSLNIDEATSKTNRKVFSILASYVDSDDNLLKVQHVLSVEVRTCIQQ